MHKGGFQPRHAIYAYGGFGLQHRDEQSLGNSAEPLTIPRADGNDFAYTHSRPPTTIQIHSINLQARPALICFDRLCTEFIIYLFIL